MPVLAGANQIAVRAWNLMGGLDWAAFPTVCLLLDADDPLGLAERLAAIREHLRNRDKPLQ
ncbi:MAG TPA: hypothetical protein VJ797_15480 [Burkholderiales bacterium]|nr:hypothetical protein [Burkholderiales bacterium]